MTPLERFLQKYQIDENGCWLWTGSKSVWGYGKVKIEGKMETAHRMAWRFFKGDIPDGLLVLHKCDIRHCVNPDHLWLGTYKDNMADCVVKGRFSSGERHYKRASTHCKNGHIFDESNTWWYRNERKCRICRRNQRRAWRARRRQEAGGVGG